MLCKTLLVSDDLLVSRKNLQIQANKGKKKWQQYHLGEFPQSKDGYNNKASLTKDNGFVSLVSATAFLADCSTFNANFVS